MDDKAQLFVYGFIIVFCILVLFFTIKYILSDKTFDLAPYLLVLALSFTILLSGFQMLEKYYSEVLINFASGGVGIFSILFVVEIFRNGLQANREAEERRQQLLKKQEMKIGKGE